MSQLDPIVLSSSDSDASTVVPRGFRFSAERVLLTYSRTGELTREEVLFTLQERFPVDEFCVASELHEDGGYHIHALIKFKGKLDRRGADLFDINDGTTVHHPNISPVKRGMANWQRAHDYVLKEDPCPLTNITRKLGWGEILDSAATAEEYLDLVRKHYPREYQANLQRYEYVAKKHFGTCLNTITEEWVPNYPHDVPGPLSELEEMDDRFSKSLVIVGPPGCGKTTWAKEHAPKPALFIRHLDSLARFRPEHRSIIFDDLDFRHLPVSTQKYLVDMENLAEVHIRYNVARIPEGIPRIITANEYPFNDDNIHGPAIDRRINKIFL